MRVRKGTKINGLLLLDKPLELSSNGVLQRVKRLFGAQKAGHTGALDPLASGVLPICFGEATKFSSFGLEADKAYIATGKLGVTTETGDCEGKIVSQKEVPDTLDSDVILSVLEKFRGVVHQIPSMYSALKYQGRPLYEYARKGQTVPRVGRDITVFELDLKAFRSGEFDIFVRCSKGTYIRTLIEDIGQALGCGAHVTKLRRVESGPYSIDECITIDQLELQVEALKVDGNPVSKDAAEGFLRPVDALISHLPEISLGNEDTSSILHGQTVRIPPASSEGLHRLYSDSRQFLGIGKLLVDGTLSSHRLISSQW